MKMRKLCKVAKDRANVVKNDIYKPYKTRETHIVSDRGVCVVHVVKDVKGMQHEQVL